MKHNQSEMDLGVKFKPPTLESVKQEALKMELPEIEAEKFFSYFSSNGWYVGKVRMKSWTWALNNWRLRIIQTQPKEQAVKKRTVYELTHIIEAKRMLSDELKRRFSSETANGRKWTNESARQEFVVHMGELRKLTKQLAEM